MWKDWQELGLVMLGGMLLVAFLSAAHHTGSGSIFGPAPAQAQAQMHAHAHAGPVILRYHSTAARTATYVYGSARQAQALCAGHVHVLRWSATRTAQLPHTCTIVPGQTGVSLATNAV